MGGRRAVAGDGVTVGQEILDIEKRWEGVFAEGESWWREPSGELVNLHCGDAELFLAAPVDIKKLIEEVKKKDQEIEALVATRDQMIEDARDEAYGEGWDEALCSNQEY